MNNYCVYKHTSPSNKVYIGITKQNPIKRWGNGSNYYYNTYFYNAILKYGWDNFKHEILYTGLNKEEAEEKEIELIAFYNSNNHEYGYNLRDGGGCASHNKTSRAKMSKSHTGKKLSEKTKRLVSVNNARYWTGKQRSEETIQKIKEAKKGKTKRGFENLRSKQVRCIETGIIYGSIHETSRQTGINPARICDVCNGKRKTTGKCHWKYVS